MKSGITGIFEATQAEQKISSTMLLIVQRVFCFLVPVIPACVSTCVFCFEPFTRIRNPMTLASKFSGPMHTGECQPCLSTLSLFTTDCFRHASLLLRMQTYQSAAKFEPQQNVQGPFTVKKRPLFDENALLAPGGLGTRQFLLIYTPPSQSPNIHCCLLLAELLCLYLGSLEVLLATQNAMTWNWSTKCKTVIKLCKLSVP